MTKMKTVLGFFVVLLLAGNAYSQMMRRAKGLQAPSTAAKEEGQCGIPGVTAPFVPFYEKDKIKYEDAVERAKKKDAEAFYWLAYYFLNGDGVEKDLKAGEKFLLKATELKSANACYLTGQCFEMYRLCNEKGDTGLLNELLPSNEARKISDKHFRAGIICTKLSLKMPEAIVPDFHRAWKCYCYTNHAATEYVIDLYLTAVKGGLTYATNDIARLKKSIVKCHERVVASGIARGKGVAALKLLASTNDKAKDIPPWKKRLEERRQQNDKIKRELEYWSSWPNKIDDEALRQLVSEVETKFNCVFIPYSTNTWFCKNGKALVINTLGATFQKIDAEGRIVAYGLNKNRTNLEEFKWYEEEKEKRLESLRAKWANEHGMTLKEAIQKHNDWNASRPTSMGLPRHPEGLIRPGLSRPECEQEKKEREQAAEERKAQLEQLMQIQEELRRQREEQIRREHENGRP